MDFKKDLQDFAVNVLKGFDPSYDDTGKDSTGIWLDIEHKLLDPKPRTVHLSDILNAKTLPSDLNLKFESLKNKIENGEDLNSHMSRKLFKNVEAPDPLLYDWGIFHLHLEQTGTKELVFAWITDAAAYLIDLLDHNVWTKKHLLDTMISNWPEEFDHVCLKDVIDVEYEIDDPAQLSQLREEGRNVIHKVNGKVYCPPGIGVTAIGTPIASSLQRQKIYRWIKNVEDDINSDPDEVKLMVEEQGKTFPSNPGFKLIIQNDHIVIIETNTKAFINSMPDFRVKVSLVNI